MITTTFINYLSYGQHAVTFLARVVVTRRLLT